MKKIMVLVVFLTVAEQMIKLYVARLGMNIFVVIIPNILLFHPVQNTYLTWLGSMLDVKTPVYILLITYIAYPALIVLVCRYLTFLYGKGRRYITGFSAFALSGICCSIIDVVFWGGSLDYIHLFNWFTFDLKDLYLTCFPLIFLVLYIISYIPYYYKLSKEERVRHNQSILSWARNGFPAK